MGYNIDINHVEFRIESQHFADLMDHLIKWHTEMVKQAGNGVLRWMDHDHCLVLLNDGDLLAYLEAWTFKPLIEITTGDICNLQYLGEKLGDEERLWEQISPWVADGSYITCTGEDGEMWRWVWREGRFFTIEPEIIYPDPIEIGVGHVSQAFNDEELNAARVAVGWDDPSTTIVKTFITPPDTNYALNALRGTNAAHTG